MSELDRVRELLYEEGVNYLNRSSDITIGYYTDPHTVTEAMDGSLQMTGLTAEQVMRAIGHSSNCTNSERTTAVYETGTVKCTRDYPTLYHGKFVSGLPLTVHVMKCNKCGRTYEHVNGGYEFCPRCGRRIVEVDA